MIEVTKGYSSEKTKGRHIAPGLYDEKDTSLFGLVDFLISTGRAVHLPDKPKAASVETEPAPRKPKE